MSLSNLKAEQAQSLFVTDTSDTSDETDQIDELDNYNPEIEFDDNIDPDFDPFFYER
jgi:hypothetical protein